MTNTKAPKAQPPKSERSEAEIAATDIPEAAIEQPEDDTVGRIIAEHIKPTLTGLIITGELSYDDWLKAAEFYQFLRSRTQWIIGDILRYGESRYGDKYSQAVDEHGKSQSRLSTYVYICNRFDIDRRRPELSFDHHAECGSLDPREADRVLLEAIKLRWSKQDVREEVAKINERNGVPKRGRKPGSTAAKLAASGKSPQDPLDPAALVWNGYPLSTRHRLVYQGPEVLDAQEADKAAHHHKFPHAEALVNWLTEHNFLRKEEEPCPATPLLTTPGSSGAPLSDPTVAPVTTPPASPAPAQQAPEPVSAPPEPTATLETPAPAEPKARALHDIEQLIATIGQIDMASVTVLDAKKFLRRLEPVDTFIDDLQKIIGQPPVARK